MNAPFVDRCFVVAERTVVPRTVSFAAVIAGKKDKRIFLLARSSKRIEDPTDSGVHRLDHRKIGSPLRIA